VRAISLLTGHRVGLILQPIALTVKQ